VNLAAPGILQETMVPVVDNTRCNNLLGSGSVTSNMICAGLLEGGRDACQVKKKVFINKHQSVYSYCITYKALQDLYIAQLM